MLPTATEKSITGWSPRPGRCHDQAGHGSCGLHHAHRPGTVRAANQVRLLRRLSKLGGHLERHSGGTRNKNGLARAFFWRHPPQEARVRDLPLHLFPSATMFRFECTSRVRFEGWESRMTLALTLLSGVAWTVVYVVAIRIGFQQRTYAIPAAALALNIAWESIYATHGVVAGNLSLQTYVNVAW